MMAGTLIKVDKETQSLSGELELGKNLRHENRIERIDRFKLANYKILHQNVEPRAVRQDYAVVNQRYGELPPVRNTAFLELMAETGLVNGFQESKTETPVDSVGAVHYFSGKLFFFWRRRSHALNVS